jgi:hypothetical protein
VGSGASQDGLEPAGIRTPDRPGRSLVAISTTMSRFLQWTVAELKHVEGCLPSCYHFMNLCEVRSRSLVTKVRDGVSYQTDNVWTN